MAGLRRAAAAALAGAHDGHRAGLVEAQELAEAQLEARGDAAGDLQRRARLAALDLAEHRRADARALGEVAQREVHRLAQRPHARADVDRGLGSWTATIQTYVIAYSDVSGRRQSAAVACPSSPPTCSCSPAAASSARRG